MIAVCGIDPGVIHTGCVEILFNPETSNISVSSEVVEGIDVEKIKTFTQDADRVFVEAYKPRSNFAVDTYMQESIGELKKALPSATFLNNMGVKKIVTVPLMQLLEVYNFDTPTHHQDLRSAARILLFGMIKDPDLNKLLTDIVRNHEETT